MKTFIAGMLLLTVAGEEPVTTTREKPPANNAAAKKEPVEPLHLWLRAFDTDGDGRLSISEIPQKFVNKFWKADKNRDGFLDRQELLFGKSRVSIAARHSESLKLRGQSTLLNRGKGISVSDLVTQFDKDGDGLLSREELAMGLDDSRRKEDVKVSVPRAKRGAEGDKTLADRRPGGKAAGPGTTSPISANETQPLQAPTRQSIAEDRPAAAPARQVPVAPEREPLAKKSEEPTNVTAAPKGKGDGLPNANAIIDNLDRDGDDMLDRSECVDRLATNFGMLDKDKNGKLDLQEIERGLRMARMFGVKPMTDPRTFQKSATGNRPN